MFETTNHFTILFMNKLHPDPQGPSLLDPRLVVVLFPIGTAQHRCELELAADLWLLEHHRDDEVLVRSIVGHRDGPNMFNLFQHVVWSC